MQRFGTRSPRFPSREGQGLIELAVGLIVFLAALFAVIDVGWLMYHYIVLDQAVVRATRRAGTNLLSRPQIRNEVYTSVGPSMISSTDGNTTITITTQAHDVRFASVSGPTGDPSVTLSVSYNHRFVAPWPWSASGYTIVSENTSRISTWSQVPSISF